MRYVAGSSPATSTTLLSLFAGIGPPQGSTEGIAIVCSFPIP